MENLKTYHVEHMWEINNLLDNLGKAKQYGYQHIWETDSDFAYSFRVGAVCSDYRRLLDWIDESLKVHCSIAELEVLDGDLQKVRKSFIMRPIDGVDENPMKYRLTTVNNAVGYLLVKLRNASNKDSGLEVHYDLATGKRKVNIQKSGQPIEVIYF